MLRLLSAGLMAAALAAPASAKSVLFNGGFELGVLGDTRGLRNGATYANMPTSGASSDIWRNLAGWSTISGPGMEVQTRRTIGLSPTDGNYYLELDSTANTTIRQTVALTRGRYQLSFSYSPRSNDRGTNGVHFALADLVGGTVTGPNPGHGTRVGQWTAFTYDLKIDSAGSYALDFGAVGRSDSIGGLVDNIALTPVPLPAAGLAFIAGLGALAGLARRRKV
ncbi:MAG: hypothetical protein ACRCSU_08830 [Paracoccaceae bacterium]